MAATHFRRISLSEKDGVTVVKMVDQKILDVAAIQETGSELFELVEGRGCRSLVVSFAGVDFVSAPFLGKLITLNKKAKERGAQLVLCSIIPEIMEVFKMTKLAEVFVVKDDEASAMRFFQR